MKFIGIIPARYASSRFPGKPLAKIGNRTMIERVYTRVSNVLTDVVVATDDQRIFECVESFGGRAIMTSTSHRSGTDRCYEAYQLSESDADVIINIQGDEPFIAPSQIESVMKCFESADCQIATLVRPFDKEGSYASLADPNTPKVVIGNDGRALYFSRSVIPYLRNVPQDQWPGAAQFYTHVGLYAYRADTLREIVNLPQSSLELAESLEQLCWLQAGYVIRTAETTCPTIGIDTPADLANAEKNLHILDK